MNPGPPVAPPARIRTDTSAQRRHEARAATTVADLLAFTRLPDEPTARRALDARLDTLRAALWRSPYWTGALAAHGSSPDDLRRLDDLPHLPTLDRATWARAWADLPSADPDDDEVIATPSSGSTGAPVRVVKDGFDQVHMWAVLRFWVAALGVALPARPKVVLLDALPGGLEYAADVPLLGDGRLARISTVRPEPHLRLTQEAPDVLFTDPAGLQWWLAHEGPTPRIALSSAQHLPDAHRDAVEARGVPLVDYYACTETGPIAWSCPPRRWHVLWPDVHVESVDGEVVVTRLRAGAVPVLRYRTGDRGDVGWTRCPCGVTGLVIDRLSGRRACTFRTPDGRDVDAWQLAWVFKHHGLDDFRLTWRGGSTFELEVVGAATAGLVERLCDALRVLGWPAPVVRAATVDAVPTAGLKPEPFRRA